MGFVREEAVCQIRWRMNDRCGLLDDVWCIQEVSEDYMPSETKGRLST